MRPGPESPSSRRPERFRVSRYTLGMDAFMERFVLAGGLGILFCVFAIFFFILVEILPLFGKARVERTALIETGIRDALLVGADEWNAYPFIAGTNGTLTFFDPSGQRPPKAFAAPLPEGTGITSAVYHQEAQLVAFGLSSGQYLIAEVHYRARFRENGQPLIKATVDWQAPAPADPWPGPVTGIDLFEDNEQRVLAAIVQAGTTRQMEIAAFSRETSLFKESALLPDERSFSGLEIPASPTSVHLGAGGRILVVASADEQLHVFRWTGTAWVPRQVIDPFPSGGRIASVNFIQGDVSLSLTSEDGQHHLHSLYRSPESGERTFGLTKTFPPFAGGATDFARSLRNKSFVLGNGKHLSLRFGTSASVRWETRLSVPLHHLRLGGRSGSLFGLTPDGVLHLYSVDDPHPEASFTTFFSRIWYEGHDRPRFLWQSTGGSDAFEPKLSLVPLIVGSLKGTFYALVFAIPIALLAAIYTSQFLSRDLRRFVKPVIEIMASLPSVVLGFLAALWLAPRLEDRVPSAILILAAIPAGAIALGQIWNRMPVRIRSLVPKGWEFILVLPVLVIVSLFAWHLGPLFESLAFRYTDPQTGATFGDFRLWWESWSGGQFQQRNALVVGFMMGFAVIPIIYTLSEDALSTVPRSLSSGSLALGASRWQTTARIVLPSASPGIFSAIMIGLGRAVGETMIVVMATGNTPILDFDIFSGMRTLSANIAIELPEAPQAGTLYRTLFLGAFLLFVLTFIINTFAEVLRSRLRERYKVLH